LSFSHENPEVHLFDAAGKRVRTLKGKKHAIGRFAFSPDGALLAGADYGGGGFFLVGGGGGEGAAAQAAGRRRARARVRPPRTLKAAGQRSVDQLAFTPDSKTLLGSSIDDPFCAWDVGSGQLKHTWDPFKLGLMARGAGPNEAERAMGLAFSADLKQVALGIQ